MPEYILNGEPIEVAPEHVEIFKLQNPDSELANGSSEKIARDILPTLGKLTDSPTGTQATESNVMESGSDDGSLESSEGDYEIETSTDLLTAGLTRKVPTTKKFIKDIFNTQDSVKEDDEKVISRAAEKYFSLEAMPKRELKPYDGESDFREFANTLDEDLEAYFNSKESLEKGINKYEEYKKYKETGELPKHIRFKSDIEVEQKNRKRELTEEYIGINVPEDKQIEAYLALPSVIGDEKEVVIGGKTYKNPKELYNKIKKRDAELGTTKAIDFEADYLARSEEHTSEFQSQSTISYAVFCLKKKKKNASEINNAEI